jgi:hypothetical protein
MQMATISYSPTAQEPLVHVILPLYQEERFVQESVQAILSQWRIPLRLHIYGGSDQIIQELQDSHGFSPERVIVYRNTQHLDDWEILRHLEQQELPGKYYAWALPEDVWLPYRLLEGIKSAEIAEAQNPLLICSDAILCSPTLRTLQRSLWQAQRVGSSRFLVTQAVRPVALPSSILFNHALLTLLNKSREATISPWDIAEMIAALKGSVVYLQDPLILWRETQMRFRSKSSFGERILFEGFAVWKELQMGWRRGSLAAKHLVDDSKEVPTSLQLLAQWVMLSPRSRFLTLIQGKLGPGLRWWEGLAGLSIGRNRSTWEGDALPKQLLEAPDRPASLHT